MSFNSKFAQYYYSGRSDNDTYTANELIWNFNVGEYFKFGLGPLYAYNRDGGHFISGKIDAATINIKFVSLPPRTCTSTSPSRRRISISTSGT